MKRLLASLIVLALLPGCASMKPTIRCSLDGKAEVMQGIFGIGVGQALPEADRLCAPVVAPPASGASR
jgi:hypothetical protein